MNIQIRTEIDSLKDAIISTRREIHQYPELAFDEHRTSNLVAKRLESLGIEVQTGVGKTGVVGTLKGNGKGKQGGPPGRGRKRKMKRNREKEK